MYFSFEIHIDQRWCQGHSEWPNRYDQTPIAIPWKSTAKLPTERHVCSRTLGGDVVRANTSYRLGHRIMDEAEPMAEPSGSDQALTVPVDLLPIGQLGLWDPTQVIRPEYNIGKYAGIIFTSPYAKNLQEERKLDWRIQRDDGEVTASLTVTPLLGHKTPTTTTLRVYLGLLQVWYHDQKPPNGVIRFSARQLAHVIGWRWAGTQTANRIRQHMKILSGTRLNWALSFMQPDGARALKVSDMTILASADYFEKSELTGTERFRARQRVVLKPDLVSNMLQGHVRPINYEALRNIANDTTLNLYTKLDLYLANKPRWERRSEALFREELGLVAKRYGLRKIRKQRLTALIKELNGVQLMNGTLTCWIEPTKDGDDIKLVATKTKTHHLSQRKAQLPLEDATAFAKEISVDLRRHSGGEQTEDGYLLFLAQYYPHHLIRRALAIAKADYSSYTKSIGAVFTHELERLVRKDKQLTWYAQEKVPR